MKISQSLETPNPPPPPPHYSLAPLFHAQMADFALQQGPVGELCPL